MKQRNAYFTYREDKPVIRISMPMLRDSASDDEAAFTLAMKTATCWAAISRNKSNRRWPER
ncbi:hypothetical protein [Leisingera sp. MMG026]|uniref:hypothetical protein n=1 Tax=Leisingera sp. MMG026 TaxID=2909982 RepID=UPI001F2DCD24|nr:hypothetical protein [Leisingera sp. MMG026]MCF6432195.1 hypothetical protein [Leisingera sp. MMG026]